MSGWLPGAARIVCGALCLMAGCTWLAVRHHFRREER